LERNLVRERNHLCARERNHLRVNLLLGEEKFHLWDVIARSDALREVKISVNRLLGEEKFHLWANDVSDAPVRLLRNRKNPRNLVGPSEEQNK
jgi:hypothetical protein